MKTHLGVEESIRKISTKSSTGYSGDAILKKIKDGEVMISKMALCQPY